MESHRILTGVIVLMASFPSCGGADLALFDFREPLDPALIETSATTARRAHDEEGCGLEVTVSRRGVHPYVKLLARGGRWDLSPHRHLEMEVANRGGAGVDVSGWVCSPGGFGGVGTFSLSSETWTRVAPAGKATIRIDLQAEYPDGKTTVINSADVSLVQLIFKSNTAPQSRVRIEEVRVTGSNPDGAPDLSGRLMVPSMADGTPEAGKRVRQVLPRHDGTEIYHVLYLPTNWKPNRRFPVVAEYSGNVFYSGWCYSTGRPEDSSMGYGMTEGRDYIWVNLPFVDVSHRHNEVNGWGDPDATVDYCIAAIRDLCDRYGGDPSAVFLTGFSRGALACGYIGLRTKEIADVWLGFHACQHYDGDGWRGADYDSARHVRAPRIKGRASFLTDNSRSPAARILPQLGFPAVFANSGLRAHMDIMFLDNRESNRKLRAWMADVLRRRPGTSSVSGRVTSPSGRGTPGVRVRSGCSHFAFTDPEGRYEVRSLVAGTRTVTPSRDGLTFTPAERCVALSGNPMSAVDFVAVEVAE